MGFNTFSSRLCVCAISGHKVAAGSDLSVNTLNPKPYTLDSLPRPCTPCELGPFGCRAIPLIRIMQVGVLFVGSTAAPVGDVALSLATLSRSDYLHTCYKYCPQRLSSSRRGRVLASHLNGLLQDMPKKLCFVTFAAAAGMKKASHVVTLV